jgi:hypothetical protein
MRLDRVSSSVISYSLKMTSVRVLVLRICNIYHSQCKVMENNTKVPCFVGPCHHGMARPQVADGGTASDMEGSSEYIE